MRTDRLRSVRESHQLTQAELARKVGVSQQQMYRYENSQNVPTADVLLRISQVLSVSADYLLGTVDQPNSQMREDALTPDERRALRAFREGKITELLKLVTDISEKQDQAGIAAREPAIEG